VKALLELTVIVMAPLPLSLASAMVYLRGRQAPLAGGMIVGVTWLSVQTSLALTLGFFGRLTEPFILTAEAFLLVVGGVALARVGDKTLAPVRRPRDVAQKGILIALVAVGLSVLYRALGTPIVDYDSLAYHLPAVANWYRTGSLDMLDQGSVSFYPYNFELLALLFVVPFRDQFAVGLTQLMAGCLFGLAISATAQRLGARPLHGLLASFLALSQPLTLRLAGDTLQVDLAFAAVFMSSVYFTLTCASGELHWSLLALSAALLVGTKASGFVYLGVLGLVFVIARARRRTWSTTSLEAPRPSVAIVVVCVVGALVNGGFWYIRNAVRTGNPLGFVELKILGVSLLDGHIAAADLRRSTLAAILRPTEFVDWAVLSKQVAFQLGPSLAALALAAAALIYMPRSERRLWHDPGALIALTLVLLCGLSYVYTPFSGDNGAHGWRVTAWVGQGLRFALPSVGALAVAAALGADRLGASDRLLTAMALAAGLLAFRRQAAVVAVLFALGWVSVEVFARMSRRLRGAVICATIAAALLGSLLVRAHKNATYVELFPVVRFIDQHVAPGERIGLLATNTASVFFGSRLTTDVIVLPHSQGDAAYWTAGVRNSNVRVVGVGPLPEEWWRGASELRWLESNAKDFEKIYGDDYERGSVLYRVQANGGVPGGPKRRID